MKPKIYRDTREQSGHGWSFTPNDFHDGTVVQTMNTGDYSVSGMYEDKLFVIERKGSVGEFVGNITQSDKWNCFKDELARMEQFKFAYLILEFPFSQIEQFPIGSNVPRSVWPKLRVKPDFLIKRLLEITLTFSVKVMFANDGGHRLASSLFKRVIEWHQKRS